MRARLKVVPLLAALPFTLQCHAAQMAPGSQSGTTGNPADWPNDGRFSFELPLPANINTSRDLRDSQLVANIGDVYEAPSASGIVEPFALGMTNDQVDAIIVREFPGADVGGAADHSSCREKTNDPRGGKYRVIPRAYGIGSGLDQHRYELSFIDDGGTPRVSDIKLTVRTDAANSGAMVARLSAMAKTPGTGSLPSITCTQDWGRCQHFVKPAVSFVTLEGASEVEYTATIGEFGKAKAADAALRDTQLGTKNDCTKLLGEVPTTAFAKYAGDLGSGLAPAGPIVFRMSELPVGLRSALSRHDHALDWVRPLGSDYFARFKWVTEGFAAISHTEYTIFRPSNDGSYRIVRELSSDGADFTAPGVTFAPETLQLVAILQKRLSKS